MGSPDIVQDDTLTALTRLHNKLNPEALESFHA